MSQPRASGPRPRERARAGASAWAFRSQSLKGAGQGRGNPAPATVLLGLQLTQQVSHSFLPNPILLPTVGQTPCSHWVHGNSQEDLRISRKNMVNPCSRWGGAGRRIPQSRVTAQSRRAQGRGATWCIWDNKQFRPKWSSNLQRSWSRQKPVYTRWALYVMLKASGCTLGINGATVRSASQKADLGNGWSQGGGHSRRWAEVLNWESSRRNQPRFKWGRECRGPWRPSGGSKGASQMQRQHAGQKQISTPGKWGPSGSYRLNLRFPLKIQEKYPEGRDTQWISILVVRSGLQ